MSRATRIRVRSDPQKEPRYLCPARATASSTRWPAPRPAAPGPAGTRASSPPPRGSRAFEHDDHPFDRRTSGCDPATDPAGRIAPVRPAALPRRRPRRHPRRGRADQGCDVLPLQVEARAGGRDHREPDRQRRRRRAGPADPRALRPGDTDRLLLSDRRQGHQDGPGPVRAQPDGVGRAVRRVAGEAVRTGGSRPWPGSPSRPRARATSTSTAIRRTSAG